MTRKQPSRGRRAERRATERRNRKQQQTRRRLEVPEHIKALTEGGEGGS